MNKKFKLTDYMSEGLIFVILIGMIGLLFKEESVYIYKWYFALLIVGIGFFSLTKKVFKNFTDRGYIFSKVIGVSISGMVVFWLSNLKLLKFTPVNCAIVTVLLAVVATTISTIQDKKKGNAVSIDKENLKFMIAEELMFLLLLTCLLYMKSFKPDAYGTEKFMDYGFMNTMTKLTYFPVEDIWFAHENLNYYYLGQYFAAFINQLSFNDVRFSYNIMFYTVCSMAFVEAFSCTYKLIQTKFGPKFKKAHGIIGGLLGGAGVCFEGSAHFIVFGIVLKIYNAIIGNTEYSYWFPESTRYVGYVPERMDKTITETPSYSFVIGDLHAHVINIMFVLTIIGIIIAFATQMADKKGSSQKLELDFTPKDFILKALNPTVLLCGFFTGFFQGNNYWDYAIYMMISALTVLFVDFKVYGFTKKSTLFSAIQIIFMMVIANVVILPFKLNFTKMEGGIFLCENHTLFHQLLVLWLLPVATAVVCLVFAIKDYLNDEDKAQDKKVNVLGRIIVNANIADLMVMLFTCCSIGLIIIPEVIYVKDIYNIDYARANTTFKLTYQSCIMFGIITGYAMISLFAFKKTKVKKVLACILLVPTLVCMSYYFVSCHSWFGNIFDSSRTRTLNATAFMETNPQFAEDLQVVNYLNSLDYDKPPVVLENYGDAYTDAGRMSVASGCPTVLGWYAHEWLWRFSQEAVESRATDIREIYTGYDLETTKELIKKYNIQYIYIGQLEYQSYDFAGTPINLYKLLQLGDVELQLESSYYGGYHNYLIKVNLD